ncbi:unnamed protein product [Gongylonema pulchrum]|uniref:DUF5641 domain-containing protein n=1 Tax=Gongylonema pulchrum TaxID=637853 RepID=A0A183D357_9BILA|nr:unnamed protein product [Gongylonema pulchrum]
MKQNTAVFSYLLEVLAKRDLNMLRERTQRFLKGPHSQTLQPPRIGEVVLLKEEKMPRGSWRLVKITQLNQGLGNQIRTVELQT